VLCFWFSLYGTHLHDHITSLRGEVCAHRSSLTPPFFVEVPDPGQASEQSCICVVGYQFGTYDFSIGFWNCSDHVVFFVFHFIAKIPTKKHSDENYVRRKHKLLVVTCI